MAVRRRMRKEPLDPRRSGLNGDLTWTPSDCESAPPPGATIALFEKAIAENPQRTDLRVRLAALHAELYDYAAAAACLEEAAAFETPDEPAGALLARSYNQLGRHRDALDTLVAMPGPSHERALALRGLGMDRQAEGELRAVLDDQPRHTQALRELGKLLRSGARETELLDICEALAERGVAHAQLLYMWGTVLALSGADERARKLLFDPARVTVATLSAPEGFTDIAALNDALAEELLASPHWLSSFPERDQANRGSSRLHALLGGARPQLVRTLLRLIQKQVADREFAAAGGFDPWLHARPRSAHLQVWGLLQGRGAFEEWHLHRSGWLSGVYYVRVPASVTAEGAGPGCIEFGPPRALERRMPGYVPVWRHQPREGTLLLAPSYFPHRTIANEADDLRLSIAFDVVPDS